MRIHSQYIAITALVLWSLSLLFPAIYIYTASKGPITGIYILLMGWFGFNAAWFANLFFIWAAFKVLSTAKAPLVASGLCVLLALDTFRFDSVLLDAGGGKSDVYGYGIGAVLWGLSLLLILLATGQRYIEQTKTGTDPVWGLREISIGLLLIYIVAVIYKYQDDRSGHVHPGEASLLTAGVIKRGAMCRAPVMTPLEPPIQLSGPLAISGNPEKKSSIFWGSPLTLLKWGVPVVRYLGYDIYISDGLVNAIQAQGPANASVYVAINQDNSIRFQINEYDSSGKNLREAIYEWKAFRRSATCPPQRYRASDSPRALLDTSLNIVRQKDKTISPIRHNPSIYTAMDLIEPRIISTEPLSKKGPDRVRLDKKRNFSCAGKLEYLRDFYTKGKVFERLGPALKINNTITFLPDVYRGGGVICNGDIAYYYKSLIQNKLYIRKFSVPNLKTLWHSVIVVDKKHHKVESILESENTVSMQLYAPYKSLLHIEFEPLYYHHEVKPKDKVKQD